MIVFFAFNAHADETTTIHFTGVKGTLDWCVYVGNAKINTVMAVNNEDEVGVFVKDNDGKEILVGACVYGDNTSDLYYVTVYKDDDSTAEKDGAKVNDTLIFKVWDKSDNKEYIIYSNKMQSIADEEIILSPIPPKWQSSITFGLLNLNAIEINLDIVKDGELNMKDVLAIMNALGE